MLDASFLQKKGVEMTAQETNILVGVIDGVDLTAVYSPVRVAGVCARFGLVPGSSFDVLTGYDFGLQEDQRIAFEKIKTVKPMVIVVSPPCTMFWLLQETTRARMAGDRQWDMDFELKLQKAIRHVEFCCSLYTYQASEARYFVHEHP